MILDMPVTPADVRIRTPLGVIGVRATTDSDAIDRRTKRSAAG